MITTYKRASIANKLPNVLHSSDIVKLASMDKQAKIERINNTKMPFKVRLAAMQAVSSSAAVNKVWGV